MALVLDGLTYACMRSLSLPPHKHCSVDAVRKVQKAGKVCVLDIDVQGVQKIKQTDIRPHLVFIAPPDPEQLEARLRGR